MATIFEQIESTLSGGDLSAKLDLQVTGLGQVGATVAGLIDHPPQGIEDLLGSVRALPLPDVGLGGDLPQTLASLRSAVPTDLGDVVGGITGNLDDLAGLVTDDLGKALEAGLGPILALRKLLELDLSCFADAPANGGGPPPPPPPPPPPGTPPAGTQRTAAALDQAHAALSALPASFTTEDLLGLIARGIDLSSFTTLPIPLLDDLRDGLETLLDWNAKAPAAIVASLADTLTALRTFVTASVDAAFGTLAADANAAATAISAVPLATIADTLVTRLNALRDAVAGGDLSATGPHVAAIDAALDQLPALNLDGLPALRTKLAALPGALDNQVGHVASALSPPGTLPISFPGPDPLPPVAAEIVAEIDGVLSPAVGWLQDIAAKLDLSALAGPIHTAADKVDAAVAGVEHGLATVTTEVQQLFAQVDVLLDAVDTTAITGALEDALGEFGTAVTNQLTALFAPVRAILGEAISALDTAVAGFDPATVVDALEDLIDGLASVLDDPAVTAARDQIAAAFGTAEQQLGTLSFAPVTDEVVNAIDTITNALKALDPSLLSAPMQLALQGAVALLPSDLDPLTDPLLDDFQELVDSGPGALVDQVRAPVAQLQQQVREFEPAALVGDALTQPFQDAVAKLEAFTPSTLLEPVEAELAKLKQRLADEIGPARLLSPLQAPFDALLAAFDQLKPDAIVEPLETAIGDVVDTILDALPIDEILGPVGKVLDAVQGVADVLDKGKSVLTAIGDLLDTLGDAPAEIEAFVDGVLGKLASANAGSLQSALDDLAQAGGATTATALGQRAAAATAPLLTALDTLAPGDRLAAVAQAQRGVSRSALAALPASPQKTALVAALDRADPLAPALAGPYGALATFGRDAQAAADALATELVAWDARYHAPSGALAAIAALQATPASLQQWLKDAAEPQVVAPLRALLAPAGPVRAALGPALSQLTALLTDLEGKVATFGTGPGSAGAIKTAIDALVDRLRNLDLDFLRDGLGDLFAQVRAKLVAIGPAALEPAFQQAFDAALAGLDLGQVLPQPELDQLDADVAKVVDALKALDPGKLIVDAVQPSYDEKVLPLIEAFDLSGVLDALLAALHGLRDELASELERVNAGYQAMLAAVPPLNPLSIDIEVPDVGGLF